jgi:O-acetyl-ADP-ribose deacetylase (regulator of RNase III)
MTRLVAVRGDITRLEVDAIVNAANTSLAPGGGVCGAIHAAAGSELARACREAGPCPTGEARVTPGFDLVARWVIHAVGPVWNGGGSGEEEALASAYRAALRRAREVGAHSVAFPAISTGIYGYPLEEATRVAVSTVRDDVAYHDDPGEVIFCCFGAEVLEAYRSKGVEVRE